VTAAAKGRAWRPGDGRTGIPMSESPSPRSSLRTAEVMEMTGCSMAACPVPGLAGVRLLGGEDGAGVPVNWRAQRPRVRLPGADPQRDRSTHASVLKSGGPESRRAGQGLSEPPISISPPQSPEPRSPGWETA
jgi:hypothetical protein